MLLLWKAFFTLFYHW